MQRPLRNGRMARCRSTRQHGRSRRRNNRARATGRGKPSRVRQERRRAGRRRSADRSAMGLVDAVAPARESRQRSDIVGMQRTGDRRGRATAARPPALVSASGSRTASLADACSISRRWPRRPNPVTSVQAVAPMAEQRRQRRAADCTIVAIALDDPRWYQPARPPRRGSLRCRAALSESAGHPPAIRPCAAASRDAAARSPQNRGRARRPRRCARRPTRRLPARARRGRRAASGRGHARRVGGRAGGRVATASAVSGVPPMA